MRKESRMGSPDQQTRGALLFRGTKKVVPLFRVLELTVGATCEIFIRVIDATVGRIHNDQMGINLWDI